MNGNSPEVTSSNTVTSGKKKVVKKLVKKKVVKKTKSSDVAADVIDNTSAPATNGCEENGNVESEVVVTETSVTEVTTNSTEGAVTTDTNGNADDVKPAAVEEKKKAPPVDDPSNIETFTGESVEGVEKQVSDVCE